MTPTSQVALLDHYAVLGVSSSATAADIGRAYRSQARTLHPDKYVDNTDPPHASFQQLLHAYTVLSDTNQRQLYDEQRSGQSIQPHMRPPSSRALRVHGTAILQCLTLFAVSCVLQLPS